VCCSYVLIDHFTYKVYLFLCFLNQFMHANVNRNLPNRIDEASVELLSDNDNTLIFESRFESGNLAKAVQV